MNPNYPIYIISKGRWESRKTVKALEKMKVPYHVVIEPQEYDKYAKVIDPKNIYTLPFSNLGRGSIPARNWVWDHSKSIGAKRHWILDDNIDSFWRWHNNSKVKTNSGSVFLAIEDFIDRYKNIAISGMNYYMFVRSKYMQNAFRLNTRIYSCILIKNDIPFRWRGRYNEDTDLSIRVLRSGWVTVLFNTFLAKKTTTMTMKGGNTEALYEIENGRYKMARSLQRQHPDVVQIKRRWGRWQHVVDYRPFKKNKLIKRTDIVIPKGINNYGMKLVKAC